MQRDGATISLWQAALPDYQPTNPFDASATYDVVVVGGGVTGLTTALLLQQAGKKCLLAEGHTLGFGTSGGTTAHLNTMLDTPYYTIAKDFGADAAKLVAQGAKDAIAFVATQAGPDARFSTQPGYLYAQDEKEAKELEDIVSSAQEAGCEVTWTDSIPLNDSFVKAAVFQNQGEIFISYYLFDLAKAFEAAGGVILQSCIVQKSDGEGDHKVLDTSLGEIRAERVVWATHLPPGVNILHFRNAPWRSYAAAFTLKDEAYPQGLAYDLKDPYHYHRTQEAPEGKRYVITGGFDHKTGSEENTQESFLELEAYIRGMYNVDQMAYAWSSQYFIPADGLPYIGLLPGHTRTYCATGFSGNGITLGTLAGIVLSDILLERNTPYGDLFKPSRIKPIAGFTEFVKHNAHVVSEFIGKRFEYEKVEALAELAPGEAKLADWEGKKVALYKDEGGKVHAVDPVCPHAKCVVAWNSAEKSWDCPCHGSRFSPEGVLLTGPAKHGLQPLLWEDFEGD